MKLVLIGSSTGGPGHLLKIIKNLPKGYRPCVVIAQHIGEIFLPSLVQNFVSESSVELTICEDKKIIQEGVVYFAKGEHINTIVQTQRGFEFKIENEISTTYAPNINRLFSSVALISGKFESVMGVVLTGIGDDGAQGLLELRRANAITISESADSAIVYGMPRCALENGAAQEVLTIEQIAQKIARF